MISSSRGTTRVSFVCQKCSQPLRLDQSSFSSIDDETLSELTRKYKTVIESFLACFVPISALYLSL